MKILLIAGHGAGDPGACACGYQEANLTREVTGALFTILKDYTDVTMYDTLRNMYADLKAGRSFAFTNYNYVLEVHFNAAANDPSGNGKTTGSEVLVHPNEKDVSVETEILMELQALGYTNRGVKTRDNLLNMNTCKGKQGVSYALIEVCFIDDRDDVNLYQNKKSQTITAIANGIIKGFNLQSNNQNGSQEQEEVYEMSDYLERKYKYCDDNIPLGLKDELQEAINLGIVNYGSDGFEPALSEQDVRTLVWIKRSISR